MISLCKCGGHIESLGNVFDTRTEKLTAEFRCVECRKPYRQGLRMSLQALLNFRQRNTHPTYRIRYTRSSPPAAESYGLPLISQG